MTTPPTMDDRDPYAEGVEAHDCGLSETANPYDDGGPDFMSWNDGWNAAVEAATDDEVAQAERAPGKERWHG